LVTAQFDLPPDRLTSVRQCHGTKVVLVEGDRPPPPIEADALVTRQRATVLSILSADCAPVLLADPVAGVVGAAHAGWRGALNGVLDNTVSAMLAIGASPARLVAAIGPCIGHSSYDVGSEFAAPFLAEDPASVLFFAAGDIGRPARFDLPGYIARRLARLSVGTVIRTPCDTYRQADRFFSHRRAQQRGEPVCGRMMSAIALEP
jgi:YfiH family protein